MGPKSSKFGLFYGKYSTLVDKNIDKKLRLIGYDNSEAMLDIAKKSVKLIRLR